MFFDSAEDTLTMGELQAQLPVVTEPVMSPPTPPPQPPPKFSSTSLSDQVDFPDAGYGFYSSPFDNSFSNRGNERRFSSSSPTSINTSFRSETSSFSTLLGNSSDSGLACDDSFGGLFATTSTPYRGTTDGSNLSLDFQSFNSPTRLMAAGATAAGTFPSTYTNQWSTTYSADDASSLLDDDQSPIQSFGSSDSAGAASALDASIWSSPGSSSQVPAANSNANAINWDESLARYPKHQILQFIELLKKEREASLQNGEEVRANQVQGILAQVQNYVINTFVSELSESVSTPTTITTPTSPNDGRPSHFYRGRANYTWSGQLPPCNHRNPTYSNKVFLGGLPWDITEYTLMQAFQSYGVVKIEWPGKEGGDVPTKPKGYAYAVFESEKQVKLLLQNCTHDYNHTSRGGNYYYYKVSSKKFRGKDVQVIPWAICDSNHNNRCPSSNRIDPHKTIFVGALHGMINAEGLAKIMNDLFGGVVYAGIDTDYTRYPIGSARVTFSNPHSYMEAVNSRFVFIKTSRFEKRLQVDPYLEDATCSICELQLGPYFCREIGCFGYFCRTCFRNKHANPPLSSHEPMMRTTHRNQQRPQQQQGGQGNNGGSGDYDFGQWVAVGGFNNGHHHQSSYSGNNHHYRDRRIRRDAGGDANNQHRNHNNHNGSRGHHHGFNYNGGGNNNNRHGLMSAWVPGYNGPNLQQDTYPAGGEVQAS